MADDFTPSFINSDNEVAVFIDPQPTAPAALALPEPGRITINPQSPDALDITLGPKATMALSASATLTIFELDETDTPIRHRKFHLGGG